MMICKADFEDLFPEIFLPRDIGGSTAEPSAACLARWEDDGGLATSVETTPQHNRRPIRATWSGLFHRFA